MSAPLMARLRAMILLIGATMPASAILLAPGYAATLTVTNTDDSGPGSLRQTIHDATPGDTIEFGLRGTLTLVNTFLTIDKDLIINGPGTANFVISGNSKYRIFRITAGTVTISGLALKNGYASGSDAGAGINNAGTLTLRDCTLSNMNGSGGLGGGLLNKGSATVINCQFTGCKATWGAAVFNGSTINNGTGARLAMADCTLSDNASTSGGTAVYNADRLEMLRCKLTANTNGTNGVGAVLCNEGTALLTSCTASGNTANAWYYGIVNRSNGYMELDGCTISNNEGYEGGGLANYRYIRLINCTISANNSFNAAPGYPTAGGIENGSDKSDAIATLVNCTVTGNKVTETDSGASIFCYGGNTGGEGKVYLRNTIVSHTSTRPSLFVTGAPYAAFISLGHNLATDAAPQLADPTDLKNTDPKLGILQENGGPVRTHELMADSPAVDAGSLLTFPFTDARGMARPSDGNVDGTTRADIGAFEVICEKPLPASIMAPVTDLTGTSVTLNGSVNPAGAETSVHFEWGTDTSYGKTTPVQTIPAGTQDGALSAPLSGLAPGTVYHACLVAENANGRVSTADMPFATPNPGPGMALSFTETGGFVELPPAVYVSGNLTIEGWVYVRSHHNWSRFVELGNGTSDNIILSLSTGRIGRPSFQTYNGTTVGASMMSSTTIPLNTWTHLAATVSDTTATIYLNGVPTASGTASAVRNVVRRSSFIGWNNWRNTDYDQNKIAELPDALFDEIRIWNVARTPDQISAAMGKRLTGSEAGIVALYHCDEGAGKTLRDSGPNALDGYILGPPACEPSTAPIQAIVPAYTWSDVYRATGIAGGHFTATADEIAQYNVVTDAPSANTIDLSDCTRLARKVAGIEPNQ